MRYENSYQLGCQIMTNFIMVLNCLFDCAVNTEKINAFPYFAHGPSCATVEKPMTLILSDVWLKVLQSRL